MLTIDMEECRDVGGSGRIFSHASVLAHVASVDGFDCECADFLTNFANNDFFGALEFGAVKEPIN